MRMSYLSLLAIISFHAVKCDDVYMQSLLRQMRFIKKEKYPGFNESVPRRVRACRGEVAKLTCVVSNVLNESVSWIRSRDLHILTVDDDVYTGDKRFQILVTSQTNWILRIDNVQFEDSGLYECQINTQPISHFPVHLTVFDRRYINPIEQFLDYGMNDMEDVVNDEMSLAAELSKFPREDVENTKILEGGEITLQEGAILNITCDVYIGRSQNRNPVIAPDFSDPNLSLIWLHNDQVLSDRTSHEGTLVLTKNSSRLIRSRLLILKVLLNDSGRYTCRPLKFEKSAVIKVNIVNGLQLLVPSIILLTMLNLLHILNENFCNHYL